MTEAQKLEVKEQDIRFVKNLYAQLNARNQKIHNLRKMFGRKTTDDLPAYMSFRTLTNAQIPSAYEEVYYLVACMFCEMEKPSDADRKHVKFETLLHRMWNTTDSTDRRISRLLDTDFESGQFVSQFVRLARRAVKELYSNETLDYVSLLTDLKFWDEKEHYSRHKWARTITAYYGDNEKTKEFSKEVVENEEVVK